MKISLAALSVIAVISVSLPAEADCTDVAGGAEAVDVVCLDSPVALCIDGTLTGDLEGTYFAVFESVTPAPTLAEPLRLAFEIDSLITTSNGTISSHETGTLVLNDVVGAVGCLAGCVLSGSPGACYAGCLAEYGRTEFSQDMVPYAGTGAYAAIDSGLIEAAGYGSYTTGISVLEYEGQICD